MLVTALESMKEVENLDLFILVALQVANPDMASVITQIAAMTAAYHKTIAPLKKVSPMARLTHGVRKDGTKVAVLPADHMIWSVSRYTRCFHYKCVEAGGMASIFIFTNGRAIRN